MFPGISEPKFHKTAFSSAASALFKHTGVKKFKHWCMFAFEVYKWPFQIQHLRLRMTIDNNNIFHVSNIQRALKLLLETVWLPLIYHQNEPTSKVEQRTHQCKVAVHSNLGQEVKNDMSHWRQRVK